MKPGLFLLLLACSSPFAWAQSKGANTICKNDAMLMHPATLKKLNIQLPVSQHYCYSDQTGNYVLYLAEEQDVEYQSENLSNNIAAYQFRIEDDQSLTNPIIIRDKAARNDTGVAFRQKLIEFADIDGDGRIEPILVYRFYLDDDAKINYDPYFGHLKIIMLYKGEKVVIRASTGPYHGDAFTTASENFFSLPKSVQEYLARKMKKMSEDKLFAFEHKHNYMPLKKREPYKEF
ncbi:M949_RS01915 family surface polysaccharide biosynthesis protein [Undibacterium sp. TC4M20W]|uniref:M949_RS01915 family surface polysaccharide biosynthesis protein n=1 Tax=unclassified Undibacterium TaxID=2630295 RepID=UPI003BF108A6